MYFIIIIFIFYSQFVKISQVKNKEIIITIIIVIIVPQGFEAVEWATGNISGFYKFHFSRSQ